MVMLSFAVVVCHVVMSLSVSETPSLSVITISCDIVLPKVIPDEELLMVKVAVSVPSISVSSFTVRVTVPVV